MKKGHYDYLDKIILFLSCAIIYLTRPDADITVIPLIIALILGCFLTYFDQRQLVRYSLYLIYAVVAYQYPPMIFFLPLITYDLIVESQKFLFLLPLIPLVQFFTSYSLMEDFLVFVVLLMAIFIRLKSKDLSSYHHKYYDLRDTTKELSLKMQKQNQALLEKQDNEIHLATLNERNRIAREIHDNVGHQLSSAILQIGALLAIHKDDALKAPLLQVKDTLTDSMNSIRSSVHDLYDYSIDLESQFREITGKFTFCPLHLDMSLHTSPTQKQKFALISILKESLSNIQKHSDATNVHVTLREHPSIYQLIILDNGHVPNIDITMSTGIGIKNMIQRIELLNGHIQIKTHHGFEIFISIPKEIDV